MNHWDKKSLKACDISMSFQGKKVLEQITLEVELGRIIAVLGLNGAGKTTLLRCLAGLLIPDVGHVELNGHSLYKYSNKQRGKLISYAGQGFMAETFCTVREFVVMGVTPGLRLFERPSSTQMKEADQALEQMGIAHLADDLLFETSTGERQLAFLARTLLQGASYMMMDEPTAFLDFRRQHEFFDNLRKFIAKNHTAAVISLHDPNLALTYADDILLLHQGGVIAHIQRESSDFAMKFEQCAKSIYSDRLMVTDTMHGPIVVWG